MSRLEGNRTGMASRWKGRDHASLKASELGIPVSRNQDASVALATAVTSWEGDFMRTTQCFVSFILFFCCAPHHSFAAGDTQKISVGDHSLFLDCSGLKNGPTVIMLAGAGMQSTTVVWDKVQPGVAAFASVCSYDRMEIGQSDHFGRKQTEAEIVEDLHQLLTVAGLNPPYILVGHSMGGIYARKFSDTYPGTVSGFVFVDSAHEEQVWRYAKIAPMLLFEYPEWPYYGKLQAQGWLLPGQILEWKTDAPVIVLEHGKMWPRGMFKGMSEEQYQNVKDTWHAMQIDLSARSPNGEIRTAEESGHNIHEEQPGMVVEAVRAIWMEILAKR
jgi:pimeloyl-ACP methyl ester carboxylesterase